MARTRQTARAKVDPPTQTAPQDARVIKGRSLKPDGKVDVSGNSGSQVKKTENQQGKNRVTTYEGFNLPNLFRDEWSRPAPNPPLDEPEFNLHSLLYAEDFELLDSFDLEVLFEGEDQFMNKQPKGLKDSWVFWFQSPMASWGKTIKRLYTVNTLAQLKDVLSKMTAPGMLNVKAEVFVFKRGIRPDRLDKRNSKGGCWAAFLPIAMEDSKMFLNQWWQNAIYAVTTGGVPHYKDIVGIKVAVRNLNPGQDISGVQKDRLEVWTKTASEEKMQLEIGYSLKQLLRYEGKLRLTYMTHQDVIDKSMAKANMGNGYANRRRIGGRSGGARNVRGNQQKIGNNGLFPQNDGNVVLKKNQTNRTKSGHGNQRNKVEEGRIVPSTEGQKRLGSLKQKAMYRL